MLQYAATQGKGARAVGGGDSASSGRERNYPVKPRMGQGELIHLISSEGGLPGSLVPPPAVGAMFRRKLQARKNLAPRN